jgi:glycosyltransferase involved in cell wall biosynthesis
MNILHIIDTLGVGGAEQALVNLLPELVSMGDQVHAAALRPPADLAPALETAGVTVHALPTFNKWNLLAGVQAVNRIARTVSADVVHAHLLFPGVYTGFARRFGGLQARTCITYHNLAYAPGCNKPGPGLTLRKQLNRISSSLGMDLRLAVSTAAAEHYAHALHPGPIAVLGNPVPISAIDRVAEAFTPASPDVPENLKLVLPGRLVHEKGHSILLEALAICAQEAVRFRTVFAGDGPLRHQLEQQIRNQNLPVTIAGRLAHADMLATMAAADIVVVPSRFEGFGITAAEAMTLRRPVIAARTGGLPDVVSASGTGLLFDNGDPVSLARCLIQLARDTDLRARMGEAGRRRIQERFDAPAIARQLRSCYRQLLETDP